MVAAKGIGAGPVDGGARLRTAAAARAAQRESKRGLGASAARGRDWGGRGGPRKAMASGFKERETDGGSRLHTAAVEAERRRGRDLEDE